MAAPERVDTLTVVNVADARAAYQELTARGLKALAPPTVPPWGGETRFFFRDPDGHVIEVFSRP